LIGGKNRYIVKNVKDQGIKDQNPVEVNFRSNPAPGSGVCAFSIEG